MKRPGKAPTPPAVRFWRLVNRTNTCWLWAGGLRRGYGRFRVQSPDGAWHSIGAHRFAYEQMVGPIPDGLVLDHLCRVRHCVNPAHLEPVTPRENVMRGEGWTAVNARKTHCKRGHDLAGTLVAGKAARVCRICESERKRARRLAARIAANAA